MVTGTGGGDCCNGGERTYGTFLVTIALPHDKRIKLTNTNIIISNNYTTQLNTPNDTKTVTVHSMLNDMSKKVILKNITCSACNTTSNHTQTTNTLNTLNTHGYLYFQIQLWINLNTKITDIRIIMHYPPLHLRLLVNVRYTLKLGNLPSWSVYD